MLKTVVVDGPREPDTVPRRGAARRRKADQLPYEAEGSMQFSDA